MRPHPSDRTRPTELPLSAESEELSPAPLPTEPHSKRLAERVGALRLNPWFAIVARSVAITSVMLGFSAIGAVSMATTEPGVHIASQATLHSPLEWLAPTPPPSVGSAAAPPASAAPRDAAQGPTTPLKVRPGCGEPASLCDQAQKKPSEGLTSDGKVILNVASAEVLTQLPGVGTRRAEAIVALRERLKGFRRPSDLLRVRGIGVRSLKRMLPHLVLDAPKPEAPSPPGAPKPP
jgi:competence protein ComEA